MSTLILHSLEDIPFVSKEIIHELGNRKVIAFYAEMGAGKTTLISGILRAMGIEEIDGSPTYSLVNSYVSPYFGSIFHFDVYRIKDMEEALDAGIEETLYSGGICLVEWAELIEPLLPEDTLNVRIVLNEMGERIVQLD